MKRSVKLLLTALGLYLALLLLLLAAEAGAPGASIRSFGDALWYSFITMTTVGYGDLSPVTPFGRLLGALFALCSIGILTALISLGLNQIGGQWLPRLRLRRTKNRRWYAFNAENADSAALAAALREEDGSCMLIFPAGGKLAEGRNVLRMDWQAPELLRLHGAAEGLTLFWMGGELQEDYAKALDAAADGISCCCMADFVPGKLPKGLRLFSRREALSRCYWKEHPLKKDERCIVFIGCGAAGSALLERALLTNVFEAGRTTDYHVFGDIATFAALHPEILKALDGSQAGEDRLQLHAEPWEQARELLARADRILVCTDSDEDNFSICRSLRRWYVSGAALHVRLGEKVPGLVCFGERSECLRPEFVLKDELNLRARLMNEIYNEGAAQPTAWEDLPFFLRQSNIAAADHLIVKARYLLEDESLTELSAEVCARAAARFREVFRDRAELLQEMEHRRWLRFHWMYNWQYAPKRDNARRLHPLLQPYDRLPEAERRKNAYAWEILDRLAEQS